MNGGRPFFKACYEEGARLLFKLYFRLFHKIEIGGMENVRGRSDRLIVVANHAALIDGVIIWTYLKLPFRIIVDKKRAQKLLFRPFMKNDYTVLIDSMSPYSLKGVIAKVNEGTPLLIFPEGRITRTGNFMKFYEGTGFAAYKTGASVLPIYIKGGYESLYSKKPSGRKLFAPITVTIGKVREPLRVGHLPPRLRKKEAASIIYGMLCEMFYEAHYRPSTIGREFVRACRRNGGRILYKDVTDTQVSYRKALLGAIVLGRYLSSRCAGRNVGIVLPNISATAVLFMGLQLFKKVPVFLNYASGPSSLGHAMELADLQVVVTSREFLERIKLDPSVFAGKTVIHLEEVRREISAGHKLRAFLGSIFPGRLLAMSRGEEREMAVILFTSGSEGVPKGVCLSHENILSNIWQSLSKVDVTERDYFLNALPIFHSFGLTIGTILPVLANAKVFLYVSPLHYRIVPELAYNEECTILMGTNTFLNGYSRRGHPYDFHSMRYIFCGAEALSDAVFERYAKTFGVRVMSGYGATECSPIISINNALEHEYGSVGKVLPGIQYKLVPVEGIDGDDGRTGKLYVKGRNVMLGYLKNDKANHKYLVEDEGWYDTGDIVEISNRGFLTIVGRLKRFAKISGEMISLTAVEEVLTRRFGDRRDIAVMAVSDEHKGERLVVVTNNTEVERKNVRDVLKDEGFSELAVPREVQFMKHIPKLGTGKVDYVRLRDLLRNLPVSQ